MFYAFLPLIFNKTKYLFTVLLLLTQINVAASDYIVSKVIDGDTILLNDGTRVRLIGIDTPETVHPSKPTEYFGKEASAYSKEHLQGKKIFLQFDKGNRFDKYNRLLAYVHLKDGTDYNLKMIMDGYAYAYIKYPHSRLEEYKLAEISARESEIGLWDSKKTSFLKSLIEFGKSDIIVYVTISGSKYHTGDCKYLKKSKIPIDLKQAKKNYKPCSWCKPPIYQKIKTFTISLYLSLFLCSVIVILIIRRYFYLDRKKDKT